MASRKPMGNDQTSLPFQALQLLAPPVRLVSAALWKVMKDRDVMQYGVVEEFVTSACDTVPGLLTLRHQARLTLGLRARLIFELCREQPDPKEIAEHMKRIRIPVQPSSCTSLNMERDYKIQSAVENTHALIPKLLTDAVEREHFFKEVFPSLYGTTFDQELEKLLWEFLIRLDQLLTVPSLAKTVSWLNDSPSVLEECAKAASQPQLLKILLEHQSCLGHLDPAASLPPNMGDGIITSLSLPPSGKALSQALTGSACVQETPFIQPVIGRISNENVPLMVSIRRRLQSSDVPKTSENLDSESIVRYTGVKEKLNNSNVGDSEGSGTKRKHFDDDDDDEGDNVSNEEGIQRKAKCAKKKTTRNLAQTNVTCEVKDLPADNRETLRTCLSGTGYEMLSIPNDKFLCSVWVSCLKDQPKVVLEKLSLTSARDVVDTALSRRKSEAAVITQAYRTCSDNKENTPNHPHSRKSASRFKNNAGHQETLAEMEDYVADSEDEATKNFKGRLFTKRYCKTKHGTYVPTLREYWRPCAQRRSLHDPDTKHR